MQLKESNKIAGSTIGKQLQTTKEELNMKKENFKKFVKKN